MAVRNASEEQSVLQLLRDVEEAFQEFVKNIKKECDPKVAQTQLSGTLHAVQKILQNVGKALQTARTALKGTAACAVEDVSSVYLNRAQSIRTALNIEEPEEGAEKGTDAENKAEDDLPERNKPDLAQLEKDKSHQNSEKYKLKEKAGEDKSEEEEDEEEEEDKAEEKEDNRKEKENKETYQPESRKGVKKQKDTKKKHKRRDEYKTLSLLELLTLFYDVEKTYSEQVRKLDRMLRNDTDPAELEIRKTMKNILKKTKKVARKSRSKKLSS